MIEYVQTEDAWCVMNESGEWLGWADSYLSAVTMLSSYERHKPHAGNARDVFGDKLGCGAPAALHQDDAERPVGRGDHAANDRLSRGSRRLLDRCAR